MQLIHIFHTKQHITLLTTHKEKSRCTFRCLATLYSKEKLLKSLFLQSAINSGTQNTISYLIFKADSVPAGTQVMKG